MNPTAILPQDPLQVVPATEFQPVFKQLEAIAERNPNSEAIVTPHRWWPFGYRYHYRCLTFGELWRDVCQISNGLQQYGVKPGMRVALMVPFSPEMIALVFALLRVGAVQILIDPALGRRALIDSLQSVEPEGFIGIAKAQLARWLFRARFPKSHLHISVGRFGLKPTLAQIRDCAWRETVEFAPKLADPAAIIFTSGSTGPAKGVLYTHGTFAAQVKSIQDYYQISPGGRDLACFPLFGLFNAAMGMSTVIPDMNPARPAAASPRRLVTHIHDLDVCQSFASPAVWNNIGRYCQTKSCHLPSLRKILAAGAPISPSTLARLRPFVAQECQMYTPYGATEALPIASISAQEILQQTAEATSSGRGICVGKKFDGVDWRVIAISDGPIAEISQVTILNPEEIGELIVAGRQVTEGYVANPAANRDHKILDGNTIWHRMGDVGYLDSQARFWFCGRKSQRVQSSQGTLFTIPCEAIFNQHPAIFRSALVGVGKPGSQIPYLVAEPWPEYWPTSRRLAELLRSELFERGQASPLTRGISRQQVVLKRSLPVDVRHNAKIFREKLKEWLENLLS